MIYWTVTYVYFSLNRLSKACSWMCCRDSYSGMKFQFSCWSGSVATFQRLFLFLRASSSFFFSLFLSLYHPHILPVELVTCRSPFFLLSSNTGAMFRLAFLRFSQTADVNYFLFIFYLRTLPILFFPLSFIYARNSNMTSLMPFISHTLYNWYLLLRIPFCPLTAGYFLLKYWSAII